MNWSVRRASLRDVPSLVTLCKEAVGPDDYVIDEIEESVLRSVVHVALQGTERIVGMMSYRPCLDGSAWLSQARTHPDFRRQGVARAIINSFVGLARNSRVPTIRLWSESTNREGVASFSALGFKEVGRFVRMRGVAASLSRGDRRSMGASLSAKPLRFDETLWRRVSASPIVAKGSGYVYQEWGFLPATRPVAFALAAKGLFREWEGNLVALGEHPERSEDLWVTMWDGSLSRTLAAATRFAALQDRRHADVFLPKESDLLAEARSAGFEAGSWGREAVVAELHVGSGGRARRTRPTYAELAARREGRGTTHEHNSLGWARWNP